MIVDTSGTAVGCGVGLPDTTSRLATATWGDDCCGVAVGTAFVVNVSACVPACSNWFGVTAPNVGNATLVAFGTLATTPGVGIATAAGVSVGIGLADCVVGIGVADCVAT